MKYRVSLLICLWLLAACAPATTPTATPAEPSATQPPPATSTRAPSLSPTAQPSPTRRTTATPQPTATPGPTETPTLPPTPDPVSGLGPIAYYRIYNQIDILSADLSKLLGSYQYIGDNSVNFTGGFSWSPDGQRLAFSTSTFPNIYILSLSSMQAEKITNVAGNFKINPDWSPDGRQIVFAGLIYDDLGPFNLYTMNVDGTNYQRLIQCANDCRQPSWSPDSKQIVFVTNNEIHVIQINGENERKIAAGGINTWPQWSPDGKLIAFIRAISYESTPYLYLMNPDGSGLRAMTDEPLKPRQFSWSADGRYILFDNFPDEGPFPTLWLLEVDSGKTRALSTGGGTYAPAWAPIGSSLVASAEPSPEPKQLEDCTAGWTRLKAGGSARVMGKPGDPPNRVRSEPKKGDNLVGQIEPGAVLDVLEGPVCAEGLVFWKVRAALPAMTGWTAEGDGAEYYLEPQE